MAWIESHQEMARHPKTRRVAVRLGISKAAVIGHLHLLWWWTLDFAPDGDLSGFEAEEIASVAEWEGDAEQFLQALLDTGWLDEGRRVHNWEDYAGRLVTAREGIRERQRRCREKKRDAAPPRGDDVGGVSRAGREKVAAKSQACHPDVPEKSQTRGGGVKVASPLCHAGVTVMSQLCHADVTVTSPLRHGIQNSTEQNRTEPNRERVARGRAGGPAERSGGVPSLSRSRELVAVGEPAPVGGEALRGTDSVSGKRRASGEAGRPAQAAGGSLRGAGEIPALSRQARCAEALPDAGREVAIAPPGGGDWREGGEPGREEESISSSGEGCSSDDREALRGAGQLQPGDAGRRDVPSRGGGESFVEDGVSLPRNSGDWREGGEPGYGDKSMSPCGEGRLPDDREASRGDGQVQSVDVELRDVPSRGGGESFVEDGVSLPRNSGDWREGGEPGYGDESMSPHGEGRLGDDREASRGDGQVQPGDAGRRDVPSRGGGESFVEDGVSLPRNSGDWREGGGSGYGDESMSPHGEGRLGDDREASLGDAELPPADAVERDSPSRGGGFSSGNRGGSRNPLDGRGRAWPGAGTMSREGGAGCGGQDPLPVDAIGGDDGLRAGWDGERLSREVREALQAGAEESPAEGGGSWFRADGGSSEGAERLGAEGRAGRDGEARSPGAAGGRGGRSVSPNDGAGAARVPAGAGRRAELEAREALRQDGAFREAWLGWRQHLEDLGRPLISRGQERSLLRECARRGAERAMEVIAYSITRGAKNLIWDDAPRAKRVRQPTAGGHAPNPEGWLEWLAGEYPDRAGIAYADAPESVQAEFRRAVRKTG